MVDKPSVCLQEKSRSGLYCDVHWISYNGFTCFVYSGDDLNNKGFLKVLKWV